MPHLKTTASHLMPTPHSVRNEGHICILMATRARPEMLAEVFTSLQQNTTLKDKVSLWIYVDADDETTRVAIAQKTIPAPGIDVHWHFGQQTACLGDAHEILWRVEGGQSEVYMVTCDDACFSTTGWDDILRATSAKFPDGIFLACPHDPATTDTSTYPIFGWRWLDTLQHIFSGHFPYWFEDRWVHQIGYMADRYEPLPIVMFPIRGKGRTRRMRDLPFWTRFFQMMLVERKNLARELIKAMNQDKNDQPTALEKLAVRARELAGQQDKFSDLYCIFQEERFTLHAPDERRVFNADYFKQEARAVSTLLVQAQKLMAAGDHVEALKFLDATLLSNLRVQQVQEMKIACLHALGRQSEADKLAGETLATWPRMNFARRLFRFLGMVASDGKTMLVGLFQGGKKRSS